MRPGLLTRGFLISALILMAMPPLTVFAQDVTMDDSGIYFNAGGGLALFPEVGKVKAGSWFEKDGEPFYYDSGTRKDGTPTLKERDLDASFDIGWAVGGAIGYRFGAVRAGVEGSYFTANFNEVGGIEIKQDAYDTAPGVSAFSIMANGWYEVDTGTIFSPFVGLGLGALQGTNSSGVLKDAPDGTEAIVHSGWGFAFQGGAGVAMQVADGLSIQLRYRLFGTLETTYTDETTDSDLLAGLPGSPDKAIAAIAFPLLVHGIELGLSYQL